MAAVQHEDSAVQPEDTQGGGPVPYNSGSPDGSTAVEAGRQVRRIVRF